MPTQTLGTPLPSVQDAQQSRSSLDEDDLSAYNVCLRMEKEALDKANVDMIVRARVLGYLFLNAPSANASEGMCKLLHSCDSNFGALSNLGDSFINLYIRAFRKYKVYTPTSSSHLSRSSFDKLKARIRPAPANHIEAKKQALIRDGYKCVVTQRYDYVAEDLSSVSTEEIRANGGGIHTECAHIVPESIFFNVASTNEKQSEYSSSILDVLKQFGYDVENLNGPKVHSLYNVMTMEKNFRDGFDRLELCFEETAIQNCYHIRYFKSSAVGPELATFSSTDPNNLPLPSPKLLALHAACAKVAHLSGASEQLDRLDRYVDDTRVLATDGGSSEVLTHAITDSLSRPIIATAWI